MNNVDCCSKADFSTDTVFKIWNSTAQSSPPLLYLPVQKRKVSKNGLFMKCKNVTHPAAVAGEQLLL